MAIPKYLKPIDEAKANKIIEKCLKTGKGYYEHHFFEGQSNESYWSLRNWSAQFIRR